MDMDTAKRSFDLSTKKMITDAIQGSQSPRAINHNLSQKFWEGFYFLPLSPVPWSKVVQNLSVWGRNYSVIFQH